jgi:hypothetical protein
MSTINRKFLILNICAFLLIGAFSFTVLSNSNLVEEQDQRIDEQKAISLRNNYNSEAKPLNSVLEAVYLDRQSIADINMVLASNSASGGVRVYLGKNSSGETANILVNTLGNEAKDQTSFIVQSAGAMKICPTNCDYNSPLMKE